MIGYIAVKILILYMIVFFSSINIKITNYV